MKPIAGIFATITAFSPVVGEAATTYTNQSAFQAALDDSFTLIDTSENGGASTETLSAATPNATFFGPQSSVRGYDGVLLNGQFFLGEATPSLGLTFDTPVNGVGALTFTIDGGQVIAFAGPDGTGAEVGRVDYGKGGGFGGLISDMAIRSVIFTCTQDGDLACSLVDPQFGTTSSVTANVPLPASGLLLLGGFGLAAMLRRRGV